MNKSVFIFGLGYSTLALATELKRRGYTVAPTEVLDFRFTTKMERFTDERQP